LASLAANGGTTALTPSSLDIPSGMRSDGVQEQDAVATTSNGRILTDVNGPAPRLRRVRFRVIWNQE
jgi:hypothetical protein